MWLEAVGPSGVLIYKIVSNRLFTREQPRKMGFMGRNAFTKSKFVSYSSKFLAQKKQKIVEFRPNECGLPH